MVHASVVQECCEDTCSGRDTLRFFVRVKLFPHALSSVDALQNKLAVCPICCALPQRGGSTVSCIASLVQSVGLC